MDSLENIFRVISAFSWLAIALTVSQGTFLSRLKIADFSRSRFFIGAAMILSVFAVGLGASGIAPGYMILSFWAAAAIFSAGVVLWVGYQITRASCRREHQQRSQESADARSLIQQLDAANRKLRDLSDISCDWLWQSDEQGRISYISDGIRNALGYGPERFIGRPLQDIIDGNPDNSEVERQQEAISQQRPFRDFGFQLEDSESRPRNMTISGSPWFDQHGQFGGYRGIGLDKTQAVHLQEAKAAAEAKDSFLAAMSHEMRTPLNGILGVLEILSDTKLSTDQAGLIGTAQTSGESLLNLINEVLDFSKIRAGRLELDPGETNLEELVAKTVGSLRALALRSGNRLEYNVAGNLPLGVSVDGKRYQQILVNLIGNAIKFTAKGTIQITLEVEEAASGRACIRTCVRDTGVGISADKVMTVFDEFTMLKCEEVGTVQGTGLGLALCQQLVRAMDGEIGVESEPGKGSNFWYRLELPVVEPAAVPMKLVNQDRPEMPVHSAMEILIAEDNPTNAMVATRMLASAGHKVHHVANGLAAVEAVRAKRYHLILMDISMPVMDGKSATRQIRREEREDGRLPIPIIGLTAHAGSQELKEILGCGMDDCLSKPVRRAELLDRVAGVSTPDDHSETEKTPDRLVEAVPEYSAGQSAEVTAVVQPKSARNKKSRADAGVLPVIDEEILQQLAIDTDCQDLSELTDLFEKEMTFRKTELRRASQTTDVKLLMDTCHALVGSSNTIGAMRIGAICKRLEDACGKRSDPALLKHIGKLEKEISVAVITARGLSRTSAHPSGDGGSPIASAVSG
ncbi:MAG: response regulator [Alphaproteobacteria bacterium]|nr:response regulator [Alphaproteobacteria bacterium]